MVMKLQLCSKPFIRTTLSNTWLCDYVVYENCEDQGYITYLCEFFVSVFFQVFMVLNTKEMIIVLLLFQLRLTNS